MDDLRDKYLTAIMAAEDEVALEDLRLQAVGKKGEVSLKMRELGKMTPEQRQSAGPKLNALKTTCRHKLRSLGRKLLTGQHWVLSKFPVTS